MNYEEAKTKWVGISRRRKVSEMQRRVTRYKVYFDRSRMYISYVQFFILLLVFTEAYKDTAFGVWFYAHKFITVPAFFIAFMVGSMVVGYLDRKYIRPGEQDELMKTNPPWQEMKGKIDELHQKLL